MNNGYGVANGGSYNYWDKAYSGAGAASTDFAPLAGGLGDLTDGVVANQRWDQVENQDGTGPYVGYARDAWQIVFRFAQPLAFEQVTVWHDDANGYGNVATPAGFDVAVGAQTQSFAITDPAGDAPFSSPLALGPGFVGDTLTLTVHRRDTAVFLSEVQFNAAPVPEPATWAMLALGLAAVAWRQRRAEAA